MVNAGKTLSALLAFGLVERCVADYNSTAQTVTYFPIVKEWDGEGSNITVTFDLIKSNYTSLYNDTLTLDKRTSIDVTATAGIIGSGATVIIAANAALEIYKSITQIIKEKAEEKSCTLTYGTEYDGVHYEGYAYEATSSSIKCGTTAEKKTILAAVKKCANTLHSQGAIRGCCKFSHGGTWRGHLRLTGNPSKFPAHSVTC